MALSREESRFALWQRATLRLALEVAAELQVARQRRRGLGIPRALAPAGGAGSGRSAFGTLLVTAWCAATLVICLLFLPCSSASGGDSVGKNRVGNSAEPPPPSGALAAHHARPRLLVQGAFARPVEYPSFSGKAGRAGHGGAEPAALLGGHLRDGSEGFLSRELRNDCL